MMENTVTSNNSTYDSYDYDYVSSPFPPLENTGAYRSDCVVLIVANIIIVVAGLCGNSLVIWIVGFKIKRTVNTTWYLSLAISDFLFCFCLPLSTAYTASQNWVFGEPMCKYTSFIMFLNMFSSIIILVIISIDRCLSVVFPVWAQNNRTMKKAFIVIIFAWTISCALSAPSAIFRATKLKGERTVCYNDFQPPSIHSAVVFSRFVFGFLLPFLIIISCYSIIICKIRSNRVTKSSKPFKIMSALIATFFICWLPYHIIILIETNKKHQGSENLHLYTNMFVTLASANSFLNPFLYAFMGEGVKSKFWRTLLSKIENAIGEETHTTNRWVSGSSTVEGLNTKASTQF